MPNITEGKWTDVPSVPKKVGGSKVDDRFHGTIGNSKSGGASPSNIAGGSSKPSQTPKARLFGTIPKESVGEDKANVKNVDATQGRQLSGMAKRLNDSPGAIKRGRA